MASDLPLRGGAVQFPNSDDEGSLASPSEWDSISPFPPQPGNLLPSDLPSPSIHASAAATLTSPPNWKDETSGRRIRYEQGSSIDWTFEYTKERQRLRSLMARGGMNTSHLSLGWGAYIRQLADSGQIWIVLIATGLAAGTTAAFIDVVGGWLADLKTGFCSDMGSGGHFYLNKGFCCWGHEDYGNCKDWRSWSTAFGVSKVAWIPNYFMFSLLSIVFAVTASFLVHRYAIYAKHSGIPEIKAVLGGLVLYEFLGPRTLLIKSLGLCLSFASGLWLGKEGPLVHVACCFANIFSHLSPVLRNNEARKREVFAAASAAGFSAAFGSPIGGVLFSLEQLSYYFPDTTMWQSFVTAMIGAVTLQFLNPFRTGKLVLYQVTYHHGWLGFEMVPYIFIGIIGGLHGGLFVRLNMKVAAIRKRWQINTRFPVFEVFAISVVTALVSFPIKFMRVQATELLYILFAECADIVGDDSFGLCKGGLANTGVMFSLLATAFMGFFLAAVTFGSLIPAGVLLPSMALGALYGRAVGLFVSVIQTTYPDILIFSSCGIDGPCIRPGTYAIIGAASALAGTTRMIVSVVVIMFELTGALTYALPIMIAAIISKWVGDAVSRRGIYEAWVRHNNYPLLDNRDDNHGNAGGIPDIQASEVMVPIDELVAINATGHTIGSLMGMLENHDYEGFPVVDSSLVGGNYSGADSKPITGVSSTSIDKSSARLIGYISRTELDSALAAALSPPQELPTSTQVSFLSPSDHDQSSPHPSSSSTPTFTPLSPTLNLQSWIDHTNIALDVKSSFQLTVNMFQRLGLQYIMFVEQGYLRGLLTKKDVWLVMTEVIDETDCAAGDSCGDAYNTINSNTTNGGSSGAQYSAVPSGATGRNIFSQPPLSANSESNFSPLLDRIKALRSRQGRHQHEDQGHRREVR